MSDLARFDQANSASGLLRRYVQGRVRAISARLAVAAAGCLCLMVLVSTELGLLAVLVTFPLELAEYFTLCRLRRRDDFDGPQIGKLVTLTSLVQTTGVGICLVLTGIQSNELRLLAWAFLFGAIINSVLTANFHPASHRVRLAVLATACLTIFGYTYVAGSVALAGLVTEFAAVVAMVMMLFYLFTHLSRREERMIRAERELLVRSETAQRLALVAKHATDSIMMMDANTNVIWVNGQFTAATGYSLDEAIGKNPGELLNHPDTDPAALEKLINAGREKKAVSVRLLNRTKSGELIWIETHQTPVLREDGSVEAFIAVERDVTSKVADEEQLKAALIGAKEADREKAAFLSRMSHELRTPANGIVGGLELLAAEDVCKDHGDILTILKDASDRLVELVENIVAVADVSDGKVEAASKPMSIGAVVQCVVDPLLKQADEKGLSLSVKIHRSAQNEVLSDRDIWNDILRNLVGNAIKFTQSGAVEIEAAVDTSGSMCVSVRDTGIGIAPEELDRVFEKFGQADVGNTRLYDGAGLGLALVEELVDLMNGTISVQSCQNEGSTFSVKVPVGFSTDPVVDEREFPEPAKFMAAKMERSAPSEALRLLVAEDNRTNRLLIKSMLKGAGHDIHFAEDGARAIEEYESEIPALIFMDVSMPTKNGLDATREIRALEKKRVLPRCPIFAVTANVSEEDKRRCIEAGMDGFIAKPLRKSLLLQTIKEVSQRKKSA